MTADGKQTEIIISSSTTYRWNYQN